MKTIRFAKHNILLCILLMLTFMGGMGWQLSTWLFSDDFPYMFSLSQEGGCNGFWFCDGKSYSSISEAFESSWLHWIYVNGRLANILYIFMQMLPVRVVSGFCGVLVALCLLLVWYVSGNRRMPRSTTVLIGSVIMFWTMLPWYDGMQSSVYIINYAFTSCLMLSTICCVQKLLCVDAGSRRNLVVLTAMLGFVTGWMHEAFGAVLIAYFVVLFFIYRNDCRKWLFAVIAATFVGFALATLSPGTISRLGVTVSDDLGSYQYVVTKYLRQLWPVYVSSILFFVALWRAGRKEGEKKSRKEFAIETMPYIAGLLCGVALAIVLIVMGRGLWPANLMALILSIKSLMAIADDMGKTENKDAKKHGVFTTLMACTFIVFYALWLVELVKWENVFGKEQHNIANALSANKSCSLVFADIHKNSDAPWWLNGMVYRSAESSTFENMTMTRSTSRTDSISAEHVFSAVVPTRFKGKRFEEWDKIPGSNPFRGEYPVMISDTLIVFSRANITVGEPLNNFSPAQWVQAFMRGGIQGTHRMTYNDMLVVTVVDGPDGLLYIYLPFQMPCTLRDRSIVSVDLTEGTFMPNVTKKKALQYSELKDVEYLVED